MSSTEEELQKIYENNLSSWKKLLNGICVSICDRLQAAELKFTSKVRIKSLESLYAKKQRLNDEKIDQDQKIKDLLGLRFIVPFLDDAERVVDIIKETLEVVEVDRKSEGLSYREFAYDSVHVEISLDKFRIMLPDFCSPICEIQIRTILQEAWAEIEHDLIYKSDIEVSGNKSTRKKIAALNANLVLSDMVFQEIRDKQKELEIWGRERFQELQKRARGVSLNSLPEYQGYVDKADWKNKTENNLETSLLKALEAHNDEKYLHAIDLYSQALSLVRSLKVRAIIYNHRGLAFFMLSKERHALKDFEDSIKCDPGYYQALNNRALVLRRMGLTNEANYNFDKSLEIEEKQADVYFFKAQTHFETQDYQSALEDLQKAISLRSDYQEARILFEQVSNKDPESKRKELH